MIARVRIAPFERWCESRRTGKHEEARKRSEGFAVEIVTESCTKSRWCDGKMWQLNEESVDSFRESVGLQPRINNLGPRFMCEHMLEMD